MNRFILFIVLLACVSCYRVDNLRPSIKYDVFYDECDVNDSVFCAANFSTEHNVAHIEFFKKELHFRDSITRVMYDKVYHFRRDTVIIKVREYFYPPHEFEEMLIEKRSIKRDTTFFLFDDEMYCTWRFYDKMYALIKE